LALKSKAFSVIKQNNGHNALQGHQFWHQWKACMQLPINE